uniref:hypothetical protein n=1 Tax=Streptomyces sp. CA-141956 TaxID=3240051 RepID=UPI003F49608B
MAAAVVVGVGDVPVLGGVGVAGRRQCAGGVVVGVEVAVVRLGDEFGPCVERGCGGLGLVLGGDEPEDRRVPFATGSAPLPTCAR